MTAEKRRPAPPIYIWIITFVIFSVFLICWFPKYKEYTLINLDSGRLEKLREIPRSDTVTKVVIIGTSLAARGILSDEALEQLAMAKGYGNYKMVMFVQQSASLYDFYFLFNRVLTANPDMIIIQSSLALYGIPKRAYLKLFYEDFTNSLRRAISARTGRMKWDSISSMNDYALDKKIVHTYLQGKMSSRMDEKIPTELTKDVLDRKIDERKSWRLYEVPFSGWFGNFLKSAREKGIDVIILNIPVSVEFDPYLPGTTLQRSEVIQEYRQKFGVHYIDWEGGMPRENFSDFVHMTLSNKLKYSDWLLRQLQSMRSQSLGK
jgi:hypothetical protein